MRETIAQAVIPSVNLYGHALDLTITIYRDQREGWNSETQSPDPYTTFTTVLTGATNVSQGDDSEESARKTANALFSWYVGMSERHPTFKANRAWLDANRPGGPSARPW